MEFGDAPASTYKREQVTEFKKAAADYDRYAGRAYQDAEKAGKKASDFVPEKLISYSPRVLILSIDTTGSMGEAPKTIFGKIPFLAVGAREFLGDNAEVSFTSIGDANWKGRSDAEEKYPIQFRPFLSLNSQTELANKIKELVPEKKGGGGGNESYQLAAYYLTRKLETPNTAKPTYIIIGDERPYPFVEPGQAKEYTFIDTNRIIPTEQVFEELQKKCSVYLIRRRYDEPMMDREIDETWRRLLGRNRIAYLLDDTRVVDIIFGILAKETERVGDFWKELEERQTPEQVDLVERCLEPVIGLRPSRKTGVSTARSKPLV